MGAELYENWEKKKSLVAREGLRDGAEKDVAPVNMAGGRLFADEREPLLEQLGVAQLWYGLCLSTKTPYE